MELGAVQLCAALITSTRAPASGAYSRVSSSASETTAPASSRPANANHPPRPYTRARASAETSVNAVTNTVWVIAVRTPMSRTRAARTANARDSSAGRPNSLTSVAPGAENRSVIWVPIIALCSAASRLSRASRLPIRRAGSTNNGSSTNANTVICQEIPTMAMSVNVRVTRLPATPDSVLLRRAAPPSRRCSAG